jgi:DNA-binding MarR family transcriptional regulator
MSREEVSIGALSPLVGYHLRRASGAFAFDFGVAMEGTGLRQVTFAALAVVAANPGINQGAVGRVLGIKRANMVALMNEMVDRKLIDRSVDSNDRRAFSLAATSLGETALAEARRRIAEHERRMLRDFTSEERALLLELLGRIEGRGSVTESDEAAAA